tara:strand:+ start:2090 stop:3337 length:1248 start_codon:yes stop_codon:yes gene_type:complete
MIKNRRGGSGAGSRRKSQPTGKENTIPAIVTDIILDEESKPISDKLVSPTSIGAIQFKILGKGGLTDSGGGNVVAFPLDTSSFTLPLKNEVVDLIKVGTGYRYQRRTGGEFQNFNSTETSLDDFLKSRQVDSNPKGESAGYESTSNTGISNSNADGETTGFGEYFVPSETIHRLKLYEGDTLIQSRFGQSIRFSGYNNQDETESPTIIIRNRESDITQNDVEQPDPVEEDVNRDGSIISMTSQDYLLEFQPGVVDDGGSTDFETKPEMFEDYPSELKGDQILINSGRVIISAKESEMIFYSKGNYGFISDKSLSIDNEGGIFAQTNDNMEWNTQGNNFIINSDGGKIYLGEDGNEDEPVALGQTLIDIMGEILDALQAETHPTPAGPSGPPVNSATYASIKSKLETILSKQNFTV